MINTQRPQEEVITKIQKLLALGQSPNENEAKLAMLNANKMLTKYNLSILDVSAEEKNKDVTEFSFEIGKRVPKWKSALLNGICMTNFCKLVITKMHNSHFVIIGKDCNIQVAFELYLYLSEAVEKWAKTHAGKGTAAKNSYKIGMVMGLCERLDEVKKQAEKEGIEETTAVVVYNLHKQNEKENWDYINNRFGKLSTSKSKTNISNGNEFIKGRNDSANISLNKQIK